MISLKPYYFIFFLWISLSVPSRAQYYNSGEDPASIRWKQIRTTNFQIIFPSEFAKEANRLANTLEYLYDHDAKTLNHKPRKISVLLHSQSSYSNGMVAWAPKRMELYTTPQQENYGQDWLDQLAVHELRHVVQIDKLDQGITQIANILFGQQAVGAITGLLPRWFLEGDAVNTETALTATGRGRTASFEMQMKTLVTSENSLYSYEKALRGSYKDYVPDWYQLGYPMVAWTRKNFGTDVFSNDIDFVAKRPFVAYPFPLSLKKQIGLPGGRLYRAAFTDLKHQWTSQINTVKPEEYTPWKTRNKKSYTNYQFPQYVNDTTLLVVKSGMDQLNEFTLVYKNGKEKNIHTPGTYNMDAFSYAAGKYVWAEEIPDIRWPNRSYSCIKLGDLKKNSVSLLTRRTRYFAPALSPDGTKIATVEITRQNEYFLVILDAVSGNIIEQIVSPGQQLLQLPKWLANGNDIAMLATGKNGKSMVIFNDRDKSWKTIVPPTFRNMTQPSDAGDYIAFVSDDNGTDNLWAVNKYNKSVWQITNAKYGVGGPQISPNKDQISFAQYSSQGFDIVSAPFDPTSWKNKNEVSDHSIKLYEASAKQENFNLQDSVVPIKEYGVGSYSRLTHLINVHSWAPFYYTYDNADVYNNRISPGLMLLSQDKLGTCVSSLGYSYDMYHPKQSFWNANITYKALFPAISFSMDYGGQEIVHRESQKLPPLFNDKIHTYTTIYFPLNFTSGCYITGLTPSMQWEYKNELFINPTARDSSYHKGMSYISYGLYAYSYLRTSVRDLAPRWGFSFTGRYLSTPFENVQFNSLWYVRGKFYLPGLLNHHSLQLSLGYQEQSPLRYLFSSSLDFPRGYNDQTTYRLTAFTSDYAFPIFYPDLAAGALLYVKRIKGNLFCDVAENKYKFQNARNGPIYWGTENLVSTGMDLMADFHLLRIIFPISAGVRIIYLPQSGQYLSQLLMSVDLTNY
jgi:hypothetical protein